MSSFDPSATSPVPVPPRPTSGGRSHRRRRSQIFIPPDAEGRGAFLAALARRAYPTYELFVFAALCGAIIGLGYALDSQALLLLGVLVAPLLSPWVGLLVAGIIGSVRFFFETLMALLVSALLVFITGIVAGLSTRPFLPRTFSEAFTHSRLWWPDLVVLALGAVIFIISFVRSEAKPFLPSVILAYEFFLPLGAGGFGLGSGLSDLWPHGLLVFLVHFAWAGMFGLVTLVALRILPGNTAGVVLSAALACVLLVILVALMSGGIWTPGFASESAALSPTLDSSTAPPDASTVAPTTTPPFETATAEQTLQSTPIPLTLEATLPSTDTPTATMTFEPTPVYVRVRAPNGGANVRATPGGKVVAFLDNDAFVQLLDDTQPFSGLTWHHVVVVHNGVQIDGWIAETYLDLSTPAPTSMPSAASTSTPGQ